MKQPNTKETDLLNHLRLKIERAWNASHDQELVHTLARQYPQLSANLYEFFGDIVAMSLAPEEPPPSFNEAGDRMLMWLEAEGFRKIAQARQGPKESTPPTPAPTPSSQARNLVAFLKGRTDQDMEGLAWALGITSRFLLDLSDHPGLVPEKARHEVAHRAESRWAIAKLETLHILQQLAPQRPMQLAASRSKPFSSKSMTYEKLVRRSDLDEEQKKFWLSLA